MARPSNVATPDAPGTPEKPRRTARARELLAIMRAEPVGGRLLRLKRLLYWFTASAFDRQAKVQEAMLDAVDDLDRELARLRIAMRSVAPGPAPVPEQTTPTDPNGRPARLVDFLAQQPWGELFSDVRPVDLAAPALEWLAAPPARFIEHILGRPPLAFERIAHDPAQYKQPTTYPIAQLHRLWVTLREAERHLRDARIVVDLGAFPFSLDILLREYVGYEGRIIATANLPIEAEWSAELDRRRIEIAHLDLDPHVHDPSGIADLPSRLDLADDSADLVILTHVIEHLYHPLGVLKEAFRVLRPGGHVLVSTDNAFMLETFLRLGWLGPFLHEPVEGTSAMSVHFWRGHNRFFSEADVATILQAAGFGAIETRFFEVLYNSFSEAHFVQPVASLPKWRADILGSIPGHRNEMVVMAQKGDRAI